MVSNIYCAKLLQPFNGPWWFNLLEFCKLYITVKVVILEVVAPSNLFYRIKHCLQKAYEFIPDRENIYGLNYCFASKVWENISWHVLAPIDGYIYLFPCQY